MGSNPFDDLNNSLEDIIKSYQKDIEDEESKYQKKYYSKTQPPALLNVFGDIAMAIPVFFSNLINKVRNLFSAGAGGGGDGDTNEPENSNENNENKPRGIKMRLNWKAVTGVVVLLLVLIATPLMFGINDAGHRTVVQYPSGKLYVKFTPGLYTQWFGRVDEYNDVITFDYDKTENTEKATIDQAGIAVRYQDGGTGHVYGITRLKLPSDESTMVAVHKEFRSNAGVASKLIKPAVESVMNHTAGLMTSEESYAEKRGTYAQYARDQIERGKYTTEQEEITTVEFGYEYCLHDDLADELVDECRKVKRTTKMIPIISINEKGLQEHDKSDLQAYGISVTGFELTDWGFEDKTLDQIATKRKATMAIITAKAKAEEAKQDAITAEQQGLANVVEEQYVQEVLKKKAVVIAEREKEVAEIGAEQKVEVARQQKLEAEQLKLAAVEYKQEQELRGEGDGAYKKAVMESDGYAIQKIDAWKEVQIVAFSELAKQKWSPEIVMGGNSEGNTGAGSNLEKLMNIVAVKAAKDLNLDMSIKTNTQK